MKIRIAAAAAALCVLAAAPVQAGGGERRAHYVISWNGPVEYAGTRLHRTAIEDGYFGHGSLGRGGRFEYDRGYPYDYYPAWQEGEEELAYAEEPMSSGRGCERQWVRDGRKGKAEVRVCRR